MAFQQLEISRDINTPANIDSYYAKIKDLFNHISGIQYQIKQYVELAIQPLVLFSPTYNDEAKNFYEE